MSSPSPIALALGTTACVASAAPPPVDRPADPVTVAPARAIAADEPGPLALNPGVTYRRVVHEGVGYRIVSVDLRQAELGLIGQRDGAPHDANALASFLGDGWVVATNAGLYHSVHEPVGLHVEDGVELQPLERGDGYGNFYLRPNGVFAVDDAGARIVETSAWARVGTVRLAVQSGPALVLGGTFHPALDPKSRFVAVRNAVGVSDARTVHLVLSEGEVRMWDLATVLRDTLGCTDALYLDGNISGMWGPALPPWPKVHPYAGFLVVRSGQGMRQ